MRTTRLVLIGGCAAVLAIGGLAVARWSRIEHMKAPDPSALGVTVPPVLRGYWTAGTDDMRSTAFLDPLTGAEDRTSAEDVIASLADRGWTPTRTDCSGDPPCRRSVPAGQVFVDRRGAYLRACRIGTDDRTAVPDTQAGSRNIGCREVVAAARRNGAHDGQLAFVLEYPRFGIGRWTD